MCTNQARPNMAGQLIADKVRTLSSSNQCLEVDQLDQTATVITIFPAGREVSA